MSNESPIMILPYLHEMLGQTVGCHIGTFQQSVVGWLVVATGLAIMAICLQYTSHSRFNLSDKHVACSLSKNDKCWSI